MLYSGLLLHRFGVSLQLYCRCIYVSSFVIYPHSLLRNRIAKHLKRIWPTAVHQEKESVQFFNLFYFLHDSGRKVSLAD